MVKYFDELSTALQRAANFTMLRIKVEENYVSWNKSSKSWTGGNGLIENGEVDLVTAWYFINSETFHVADYTTDLIELECFLWMNKPKPKQAFTWLAYIEVYL